jgi:hypothetical protein
MNHSLPPPLAKMPHNPNEPQPSRFIIVTPEQFRTGYRRGGQHHDYRLISRLADGNLAVADPDEPLSP